MRFQFCGGQDCPDWLLAEIASLATVSVLRVRQLGLEVGWGARVLLLLQAAQSMSQARPLTDDRLAFLALETKLAHQEVRLQARPVTSCSRWQPSSRPCAGFCREVPGTPCSTRCCFLQDNHSLVS